MIENWRSCVREGDTTIHLGDVIFGDNKEQLKEILESIPGFKILVRGNHDKKPVKWYLDHGFHFVCDAFVLDNVLFTHIPVAIPEGIRLNVHGHFHNTTHRSRKPEFQAILCDKHKLLAVEYTHYQPVLLETFISNEK